MTRKEARQHAHEAAVRSGDRAYVYRERGDGLEEVRVWPNGDTTYTAVGPSGAAASGPRKAATRAGGWRNNVRAPSAGVVAALGFVALLLERLI